MNRGLRLFVVLFVATQVALPAFMLLFGEGPIYFNDYPVTLYLQHRAVLFFGNSWNLWGYDPFYSAGFPLNFTWNNSQDLQMLSVLLHPLTEAFVLRLSLVAYLALVPVTFWMGLGNFGVAGRGRAAAMLALTAYWWTGLPVSLLQIGMLSTILVFQLSFLTVSFYYRFLIDGNDRALPWLYALSPLCCLAHKTAIVLLGAPALILLLVGFRNLDAKKLAHLLLICLLTLAVNSFWLVPLAHLVKYKTVIPDAPHWLCFDPLRIFKDYFTLSKIIGHRIVSPETNAPIRIMLTLNTALRDCLLAFGVAGVVSWWKRGERHAAAFFGLAALFFLALTYFGSFWSVSALLNPTRYVAALDFTLAPPAVAGASWLWGALAGASGGGRAGAMNRAASLALPPILLAVYVLSALLFVHFLSVLRNRPDADTVALTAFLNGAAPSDGRVMLEDSGWNDRDGEPPKYSNSQLPALMSDLTGREFIGGPYPYLFLKHHFADFRDGKFLESPIGSYDAQPLADEFDRYNIHIVVCWSGDCKNYFSRESERFEPLKTFGRFEVFESRGFRSSPFLKGTGYAVADHGGIRCYRVRPEDGRVILKYHAFEELVVAGGARTSAVRSGRDPIGFIEVKNPAEYFRITNDYFGVRR